MTRQRLDKGTRQNKDKLPPPKAVPPPPPKAVPPFKTRKRQEKDKIKTI